MPTTDDCDCGRPPGSCHYTDCEHKTHTVEVVTWASLARGATYAARCSCGWVGATREAMPDAANQEAAAHAAREDADHAAR